MKKVLLLALLTIFCFRYSAAQKPVVDSLTRAYQKNRQDTTLVQLLDVKAVITYSQTNTDSGMMCARRGLAISRRIHYTYGEVRSLANIAQYLNAIGDLPEALRVSFEVLPKAIALNEIYTICQCYNTLGLIYDTFNDLKKSNGYYHKALSYAIRTHINEQIFAEYNNLSRNFLDRNMLDSSLWYTNKAYALATEKHLVRHMGYIFRNFGTIQFKKGNYNQAINFYKESLAQRASSNNHNLKSDALRRMADAYQKLQMPDSGIYFAKQAYEEATFNSNPNAVMSTAASLSEAFKAKNDYRQAYEYQQIMLEAKDSLFSQQKTLQEKKLEYNEQQRLAEINAAEAAYKTKVRFYILIVVTVVFLLIALFLLYSNYTRKKANSRLYRQKEQIQTQHKALEKTLAELNDTQAQLIQSAKMASLGELTAGIAHEIQNPLNFVNNFSEVSAELMEELKEELEKGDMEEAKAITIDVIENLGKINHHGKRADGIVKSMLEHSRTNPGQKELTDLNKLTDEYLKLAYHGLRVKYKSFDAQLNTEFEDNLPKAKVNPQEIGRVLLNLFNNAFYAVNEKKKTAPVNFSPVLAISTFSENGTAIIKIRDNGTGISNAIKYKIMQPFFTTKATGEGTGLGLSLSYDIVVKGHGGSIDIDTKETEFTEFTIRLPLK